MFSVTPETTVAATSQAARSKHAPTAQTSPSGEGFAALVDDNASAAAEHDHDGPGDTSRSTPDERQPRAGASAESRTRTNTPVKAGPAHAAATEQNTPPANNKPPGAQDGTQTTQIATGVVPAGKPAVVITPGKMTATDQGGDDQSTSDGQTSPADANANGLVPAPVAVVVPVLTPADATAVPTAGDDTTTAASGPSAGSSVAIPENSLAAAAIANGAAASAATAPAAGETPATEANATTTAATTATDAATDSTAAATKPDLTAGSPVTADAAVTVAAATPAAVATTTKSTTTPAAIDMADSKKTDADPTVITPEAAKPAPQTDVSAKPVSPDSEATRQGAKQDTVATKADTPADDTSGPKPAETRDTRPAPGAHDQHERLVPTLQPDPSLQAGNTPLPQQPQIQPVTNAPIPAAQLGVALAANIPVPMNGLAVDIALKAASGKSRFEIRLDPAELGRIDVRLDVDKHGNVTSHLTVEKPATLDMLRKDAPQLQRALEDAGLKTGDSGLQFSLRDQSQSGQQNDSGAGRNAHRLIVTEDDAIPAPIAGKSYGRMLGSSSGVDIRI